MGIAMCALLLVVCASACATWLDLRVAHLKHQRDVADAVAWLRASAEVHKGAR